MVQRYTTETAYTFAAGGGASPGEIVLQSQQLRHREGAYVRRKTRAYGSMLVTTTEKYDPHAGRWWVEGRPQFEGGNPVLALSQNGLLAMEKDRQAKVFFIHPALVPASNNALHGVQIALTGISVTFPAGTLGRSAPFTLQQASIVKADGPPAVARVEDLELDRLQLATECHDLAEALIGRPTRGRRAPQARGTQTGREADPLPGQSYYFEASPPGGTGHGDSPESREIPFAGAQDAESFDQVVTELRAFDILLGGVNEHLAMTLAILIEETARAYLPGWGSHSEAVIAVDGADSVVLANYNREEEAQWVIRRIVRQMYRDHGQFRSWFQQRYQETMNRAGVAPDLFAAALHGMGMGLLEEISVYSETQGRMAERAKDSARKLGNTLWYFDMYGRATGQSFHERYQTLATRGLSEGHTIVV